MMKKVKHSFKEIMFIELRDLHQDLELLIEENRQRSENATISERVFQENIALFKNELTKWIYRYFGKNKSQRL